MLPADTLLVAGGVSTSNAAQSSVQLLDRKTGEDLRSWPMQVARVGHTATRLKNGAVLIAGGRDGAARIASSEIYVPRLSHEASLIATTRGGADEGPSYGQWLAAATNSRDYLLISYKNGTRGPALLLEWGPEEWKDPHTWNHKRGRHDHYARSLGDELPALNSIRIDERDNIWGVSSAAQEIFELSADGKVLLRFGSPQPTDNNNPSVAPRAQRSRRGHAYFEYGEPMLDAPKQVWFAPLALMNPEDRAGFENVLDGHLWPEVGSRMLTRLVTGQDLVNGW